jgi:hypothetical protein
MTDGCVHLLYNSSWKFHQLAARHFLSGQPVQYEKDRLYDPSIAYKSTPVLLFFGPPCWVSPLAFGLAGCNKGLTTLNPFSFLNSLTALISSVCIYIRRINFSRPPIIYRTESCILSHNNKADLQYVLTFYL